MNEQETQAAATERPTSARERSRRKYVIGIVTSDKMDKTIVVQVVRKEKHKTYKKYVNRYTKYRAHDEKNEARRGDKVRIQETRPLSKTKRWRLVEVLERAVQ